jgi:hypothetical protein
MDEPHGPYHRLGEPGGPAARVAVLAIQGHRPDGAVVDAELVAAEVEATEVELLRAVCERVGVQWGHDDLGWWAVVHGTSPSLN